MLSLRFFGVTRLSKCALEAHVLRINIKLQKRNMESTKRPLDESNEKKSENSKKLKGETEDAPAQKFLHSVITKRNRKPKKIALLLSYLGKDFYGLQRNQNVNTVEEELFRALLKSDIILQDEFDNPKNMKFQRAARTDKGVSAVRNIVSLKVPLQEINETLPEKINLCLPPEVRVIAHKRVTQAFDAKIACDARTYSYMLPTFAFASEIDGNAEEYRITDDKIQEVNAFLQKYLGTRNFYNFTSGRLPGDPSCKRYILSIECSPPFESNYLEFCVIKIKGQSFMLHQIRKMVGLAVAYMRNLADDSVLEKTWKNERIDIPKAPGLGLMLEELHYDWYNKKFGSDGFHDALNWDEYKDVIETFKREKICFNISKTEREEKSMLQWLETLPHHSYDVREAAPPSMLPPKVSQNNGQSTPDDSVKSEKTESSVTNETGDSEVNLDINVNIEITEMDSKQCTKSNDTEIKCES